MAILKDESGGAVISARASTDDEKPTPTTDVEIQQQSAQTPPVHDPQLPKLTGWRLKVVLTSLFVGLFLSFLDTTIVAVALPTIATQFNDFDHSTWVLTAYLLTYMAFAIIISRLSDIFGKKAIEVTSFVLFIAFSLACGLSKPLQKAIP